MDNRLVLHELLCEILGSRNVYFQPPASVKMKYPAIKYSRNNIDNKSADDSIYIQIYSYQIIVIDEDPDSKIVNKISRLPRIKWDTNYAADNLYHEVFTLIY